MCKEGFEEEAEQTKRQSVLVSLDFVVDIWLT